MQRRVFVIQSANPVGEGRERCAPFIWADLQLLQAGEMAIPGVYQVAALVIESYKSRLAAL